MPECYVSWGAPKLALEEHCCPSGSRPSLDGIPLPISGTPINVLPVEILSEIFLYLRDIAHPQLIWLQILHVCLHWQVVAFKTAKLWTEIYNCPNPSVLEHFFRLSAQCPLNIVIDHSKMPVPEFIAQLKPHGPRVASLQAKVQCHDLSAIIACAILPTLISLQTLALHLNFHCATRHPGVVSIPLELCTNVLNLLLFNIPITFESPRPMNLVKFSLLEIGELPSVEILLAVLRSSPNLKELLITEVLPSGLPPRPRRNSVVPDGCLPVHAPNLAVLSVCASGRYVRNLLGMISCPSARLWISLIPRSAHLLTPDYIQAAFPNDLRPLGFCSRINGLYVKLDRRSRDYGVATIIGMLTPPHPIAGIPAAAIMLHSEQIFTITIMLTKEHLATASKREFYSRVITSLRSFLCSASLCKNITTLLLAPPFKHAFVYELIRVLPMRVCKIERDVHGSPIRRYTV